MPRFLVVGTYYDASAHWAGFASSEDEAIGAFKRFHGDKINKFDISARNLDITTDNTMLNEASMYLWDKYQEFPAGSYNDGVSYTHCEVIC